MSFFSPEMCFQSHKGDGTDHCQEEMKNCQDKGAIQSSNRSIGRLPESTPDEERSDDSAAFYVLTKGNYGQFPNVTFYETGLVPGLSVHFYTMLPHLGVTTYLGNSCKHTGEGHVHALGWKSLMSRDGLEPLPSQAPTSLEPSEE